MPSYKHADMIDDALAGWKSQTFTDAKLIVVVDGCQETWEHLERSGLPPRTSVEWKQNEGGPSYAINFGKARLRGVRYMSWISSDNVMHPEWLEKQVECLERTGADACYSPYIRERGRMVDARWKASHRSVFRSAQAPGFHKSKNFNIGAAFLYTADFWRRVGEHRGIVAHDYDWWLRAEEQPNFRLERVDDPLCTYRVHTNRVTVRQRSQNDTEHWTAEALKRRGAP